MNFLLVKQYHIFIPLIGNELILKAWTMSRWNGWDSCYLRVAGARPIHGGTKKPQFNPQESSSERELSLISVMSQGLYFVRSSHFLDTRATGKSGSLDLFCIIDPRNAFHVLMFLFFF